VNDDEKEILKDTDMDVPVLIIGSINNHCWFEIYGHQFHVPIPAGKYAMNGNRLRWNFMSDIFPKKARYELRGMESLIRHRANPIIHQELIRHFIPELAALILSFDPFVCC
jgi:hypothetical protein